MARSRLFRTIVVFGTTLGAGAPAVGLAACDLYVGPHDHGVPDARIGDCGIHDAWPTISDAPIYDAWHGIIDAALPDAWPTIADAPTPDGGVPDGGTP